MTADWCVWRVFSALAPDDTISFSSCFFDTVSVASSVHIELLPPPSLSALITATAARQGGRVAASLVDSCELRTADKHE